MHPIIYPLPAAMLLLLAEPLQAKAILAPALQQALKFP